MMKLISIIYLRIINFFNSNESVNSLHENVDIENKNTDVDNSSEG